jgi:hypothetical protein
MKPQSPAALMIALGGPKGPAQDAAMDDPDSDGNPGQDAGQLIPIPLKALSQPDQSDKMQTPGEGDNVSFQVDAVIQSIEGDIAMVQPMSVNGTPVGQAADGEDNEDATQAGPEDAQNDDSEDAMRQMAAQQPGQ